MRIESKENSFFLLDCLLFLMGLFSTFIICRFLDRNISWFLGIVLTGVICLRYRRIKFSINDGVFLLFLVSLLITERMNVLHVISTFILYVVASQMALCSDRELRIFILGLKCSCICTLILCLAQFIYFQSFFDLNDFIFNQTLHMVDRASFGTSLTGFAWHPCNLIPVLLLSVLFVDKWYVWLICAFIAVNASSSTTLLALILALMALLFDKCMKLRRIKNQFTAQKVAVAFVAVALLVLILYNLFPLIISEYDRLTHRLVSSDDISTYLHKRYYTSIAYVWSQSGIYDILFGCGYHKSGLVFSQLFRQYTSTASWSVESDPMDYLYGNGIIGFLLFYVFLIRNTVVAFRKEYRMFVFYAVIILCGIAYNCQFEWVIQIELIFKLLMKRNIATFDQGTKKTVHYKIGKWELIV